MSRTSCIAHPAHEPLIVIHRWQLEFCKDDRGKPNECAAALLSFLEYWHGIKLEMSERNRAANDAFEREGKGRPYQESLLQWHSTGEIEAGLLIFKRSSIQTAIDLLVKKDAVEVHRNPVLRYDNTKHFLFKPDTLTSWLKEHRPNSAFRPTENSKSQGNAPLKPSLPREPLKVAGAPAENGRPSTENSRPSAENSRTIPEIPTEVSPETTPKKTTTTPRAHAKGLHLVAEEKAGVVVVSSVGCEEEEEPSKEEYWPEEESLSAQENPPWPEDEEEPEAQPTVTEELRKAFAAVDSIVTEFGLGVSARGEVHQFVASKGLDYVQEKAALTRSQPCRNTGGYFMDALRKDYQAPKSTKPAPKATQPSEPPGWREAFRANALKRYGVTNPEVPAYWKNVERSVQIEVLAELARPPAVSAPVVATGPAKIDFAAMRAAVQNVGKEVAAGS